MADRVRAINPDCRVHPLQSFFLKSTATDILQTRYDAVMDAIDAPSVKALLLAACRERALPVISAGAAGGRRDPAAVEITDLAFSTHDRLLQEVRRRLRKDHGFPRGDQPFGIPCVLSRESPVFPSADGEICADRRASGDLRLDCNSGFGTACFVTGTFGFLAAGAIVRLVAERPVAARSHTLTLAPSRPEPGPSLP